MLSTQSLLVDLLFEYFITTRHCHGKVDLCRIQLDISNKLNRFWMHHMHLCSFIHSHFTFAKFNSHSSRMWMRFCCCSLNRVSTPCNYKQLLWWCECEEHLFQNAPRISHMCDGITSNTEHTCSHSLLFPRLNADHVSTPVHIHILHILRLSLFVFFLFWFSLVSAVYFSTRRFQWH